MNRKLDKVRAGRATKLEMQNIIRTADKQWFCVLGFIHRLTIQAAVAHCRREKQRRFHCLMAWKYNHRN